MGADHCLESRRWNGRCSTIPQLGQCQALQWHCKKCRDLPPPPAFLDLVVLLPTLCSKDSHPLISAASVMHHHEPYLYKYSYTYKSVYMFVQYKYTNSSLTSLLPSRCKRESTLCGTRSGHLCPTSSHLTLSCLFVSCENSSIPRLVTDSLID